MKSFKVRADDLLDLHHEYDAAAGLLPHKEQEEHRAGFAALRAKVEAAIKGVKMSSASYMTANFKPMTVGELKALLEGCPDDYLVYVPSLYRKPGTFITADHVMVRFIERAVYLDGDVTEDGASPSTWEVKLRSKEPSDEH